MLDILNKIIKQENKNSRILKHHIGLGGSAHAPVNKLNSGFMTSDMYKQFQTDFVQRKSLAGSEATPLIMSSLPAGHYTVYQETDHPLSEGTMASWISSLDVRCGADGMKDMLLYDIGNSRMFFQTVGTDGKAKGWQRLSSAKELFSGVAHMGDTVTLSDDITKYSLIIVTMTTNDKVVGTIARQFVVGTSAVVSASQLINTTLYTFQIMITAESATTVKVIDSHEVTSDGATVSTDHCYLHKIVGISY